MRKIILILTMLFLIAPSLWTAGQEPLQIRLIAHRGLTREAPENSIAALEGAWKAGLHGSEIDVRTSADGVTVLLHDPTLSRTTNGKGEVDKKTWRELQKLRLTDSQGRPTVHDIPSLEQALTWADSHPGFHLALDLKQVDPLAVGRKVLNHGLTNRVTIFVGEVERAGMIRTIKRLSSDLRVSLNLGWWWQIEGLPAFATQGTGADALFAPEWNFPARGFAEALQAGAEVSVYLWGKDNLSDRLRNAAALGAQSVSCDYPRQLLPLVIPRKETVENKKGEGQGGHP